MYGRSDMNLACEEYDGEDEPVSLKYDVELPYYSIRTEVQSDTPDSGGVAFRHTGIYQEYVMGADEEKINKNKDKPTNYDIPIMEHTEEY